VIAARADLVPDPATRPLRERVRDFVAHARSRVHEDGFAVVSRELLDALEMDTSALCRKLAGGYCVEAEGADAYRLQRIV
jgi:hypothetical protein